MRLFAERDRPIEKLTRSMIVMRSRYVEDCLADAVVQRGIRQYLILGAGLETFAYRQPSWAKTLRIYEVDHPGTQEWKKERLKAAGIVAPANLTLAPVDFESMSLDEGLRVPGFDFSAETFCSWLGVIVYLTKEAIDKTFEFIHRLPPGSEIVFSFDVPLQVLSGMEAEVATTHRNLMAAMGEPFVSPFSPAQFETKLHRMGFSQVIHFSPDAQEWYFRGRRDGLAAQHIEQLMRAIV
jgi:methyltransferase (TIGR00027 family)